MKTIFPSLLCAGVLLFATSCGNDTTSNNETATTATDSVATENTMESADAPAMNMASDTATAPHATDEEFMKSAAHSDQNEIQLSKLVLEKGVTGMAKDHANQMVTDHTKSTADLKAIAQKKNVTLPTDMDAAHKAIATTMQKLSGKDLETQYMQQMVLDHQKTLNTMQAHDKMTQDADLKAFIAKTAPVVQNHLTMFKQHADTGAM
ncbi:DUF4142 domain-containing protein [Hymenobacter sp. NBH84]|uniref:DUF4142 domain-containing protein n=1 Tax=Hymenobacter sp. NBH84 TaxID=2596915 RepID=UPI0016282145|nr:DUF4142 domain-containing protein [Hymenobacter sp. NBH84]QNE41377.1 DUF4142 domain-containing protein [Hymenobacter sp. NBH84]